MKKRIFQVLQNRIREMADDLGDEIAERMGKIFNNMAGSTGGVRDECIDQTFRRGCYSVSNDAGKNYSWGRCKVHDLFYHIPGDVKIPRGQGIKEISWSGIFPGKARKNYPFVSSWVDPNTLIKRMEQYRDNGTICKLLVTGTCINYSVYISSFKGKYSGGLGDFYYDIKFIIAREIKIYTTKELKIGTSSKTQRPASKKSNKKSTTGSKTTTYTNQIQETR